MSGLPQYFPSPNKEMMDCLRDQMAELPIVSETEAHEHYFAIGYVLDDILKGEVGQIVSNVEMGLLQDYRENIIEIKTSPWTFDYLLDRQLLEGSNLDGLAVGTRLSSANFEGSTSYIRTIYRITTSQFLVPLD